MFQSEPEFSARPKRRLFSFAEAANRLTVKLAVPLGVIILLVALVTGFIVERYISRSIKENADAQARVKVQDVVQNLATNNRLVLEQVRSAMRVLQQEGARLGETSLGAPVLVNSETVYDVKFGAESQANNFTIVDRVKELTGGTATLFVKREDKFVRVTTNMLKDDGSRATGTELDPSGKAAAELQQGKPFYGLVDVFGKPYIGGYEPVVDQAGDVIGVWYVGYPMATLSDVGAIVEDSKVLDNGFIAVLDYLGRPVFASKNADKNFIRELAEFKNGGRAGGTVFDRMQKVGAAREMIEWNFNQQKFAPWNYTVVSAYSNADSVVTAAVSKARWTIFVGATLVALLLCGLALLLARNITRPLNQAVEVANKLAVGDLSIDLSTPRSGDETGQLLVAMENMTRYLKEMANVSDEIAAGRLSAHIEPRSSNDRFGTSFQNMTEYLQSMAGVSDEIAAGNMRVRVEPRSEQDRFGMSFKNMLDNTLSLVQSREERDAIQQSVMKLLEEVAEVANGDLTIEAEVTANETGAIADAFNYMIAELRTIITNVKQATLQVSSSANEIRETTEHLAEGSEAQAQQIIQTSNAIDEMAASIQNVSENAALSANVADDALANAQQGNKAVQNNIQAMGKIRDQVQETAKRIKRLGERSQEIGEIVGVIDDIADRTSLLALNASIQASMAGEAGRGFAVVAEEVERLADRSANATKQIATLIKTIQSETNEAVRAMEDTTREVVDGSALANEAGRALSEIEMVSNRLANLINTISASAQKQAQGSEQLAKSMTGIADVTQEVATGTKQAAVSVRSLVSLADELHSSVVTFKLPEQVAENFDAKSSTEDVLDFIPEAEELHVESYDYTIETPLEHLRRDHDSEDNHIVEPHLNATAPQAALN